MKVGGEAISITPSPIASSSALRLAAYMPVSFTLTLEQLGEFLDTARDAGGELLGKALDGQLARARHRTPQRLGGPGVEVPVVVELLAHGPGQGRAVRLASQRAARRHAQ